MQSSTKKSELESHLVSGNRYIINSSYTDEPPAHQSITHLLHSSNNNNNNNNYELKASQTVECNILDTQLLVPDQLYVSNTVEEATVESQQSNGDNNHCPSESSTVDICDETTSNDATPSLVTEDTLIIHPELQDDTRSNLVSSRSDTEMNLLRTLTKMPSVYCDLSSSAGCSETFRLHHSLSLLLETTRMVISHDEKRLEEMDFDISRIRRQFAIRAVKLDRLSARYEIIEKDLYKLGE